MSETIVNALSVPKSGRVYDLASQWWRHMPVFAGYPQFEVVTYNSPRGERVGKRFPFAEHGANEPQFGYFSELISGTLHTGTHIDALSHVTCGEHDTWHGGNLAGDTIGDFGSVAGGDAAAIAPIVRRGVLLDIPKLLGVPILGPHFEITADHLQSATDAAHVQVGSNDVVLIRTGQMQHWPDTDRIRAEADGCGVGQSGAQWLVERGIGFTGADTQAYEVRPSSIPNNPLPVHITLLHDNGIHIMEWVDCEELAADGVTTFLFVALPLTIRGASGSPIRPIAIA